MARRTVVIGAGVCGLSTAYELTRRGEDVVVLERGEAGGGQSAGLGRIFRIAHGQPRLCALALEARAGWRRWEQELGLSLLGDEGLVVASPRPAIARAMSEASAEWRTADVRDHVPFAAPGEALLDPAAGSLRTRRALTALASRVVLRGAEAVAVGEDGTVTLAGGEILRADAVLICAGADTPRLVPGFDVRFSDHVRLTYAGGPAACLISQHGYGLPLGSTGRWAFGLHDSDDADVVTATRARQGRLLPEILPGLDPHPVGEVRCVNVHAPWLDDGGDGWHAIRRGRAVAFMGANLMKFGPVLGDRLARSALEDGIHPDLVATIG